ncbi:sugar phosphate nucleotidyltransferase, partial [Bacillus sp. SIMBA_074]
MKAVIMAGGKGTRLRPLTSHTPKPMVPLLNRPCMEYTIDLLKKHGITEIAVTLQYLPDVIR